MILFCFPCFLYFFGWGGDLFWHFGLLFLFFFFGGGGGGCIFRFFVFLGGGGGI